MGCVRGRGEFSVKLLLKFNILLIAVFGLGLLLISIEARGFLQKQAQTEVLREAALMSASASATRTYTEEEVSPLLEKTVEHTTNFLPQTIPFFAAEKTFAGVRQHFPDYTYKEAALNPTNLRDRATDWEADLIQYFRNAPKETELMRSRSDAMGVSLYLAHPIRVEQGCLQCHSTPSVAPKAMLKHYGSQNGFGWNLGEVIGAQIISVPTSVPLAMAQRGLTELLLDLAGIFLLAIVLIDVGLYFIIIRRLRVISAAADRISQGEMGLAQLPVRGRDEVAQVTRSFNRMHTSLAKAMDLLNG
jgi:methyl-accepting chemotaxis protein